MNKNYSQSAIARALGLSKSRLTALKKQGCPVTSPEAAQAWREARQSISRRKATPRGAGPVSGDASPEVEEFDTAHARRESAVADIAEMQANELRSELIKASAAEKAWAAFVVRASERMAQLPGSLSTTLAAETSTNEVHRLLKDEIHAALHELAGTQPSAG